MIIRSFRRFLPALFGFALVLLTAGVAAAQSPGDQAATADADLRALIERIEDPQKRDALIADLRALLAADQPDEDAAAGPGLLDTVRESVASAIADAETSIGRLADQFGTPDATWRWLERRLSDPAWRSEAGLTALKIVAVLLAALAVAWIVRRTIAPLKRRLQDRPRPGLLLRVPLLTLRTAVEALPLLVFWFAASGLQAVAVTGPVVGAIVVAGASAITIAGLGTLIARALLTPFAPSLRLFEMPDNDAAYVYVWMRRLINWPVYAYFVGEIAQLVGVPQDGIATWTKLIGIVEALLLAVFVLQVRTTFKGWLSRTDSNSVASRPLIILRARFADFWHVLALLYIAFALAIWLLDVAGGFAGLARGTALTVVILVVGALAARILRAGINRLFVVQPELRQRYPHLQERAARYAPIARRVVEAALEILVLLLILQVWQISILSWLGTPPGLQFLGTLLTITLVAVGAVIAWETVSGVIESYLERTDENGDPVIATARARTLLPLARNAAVLLIGTVAVIIVLSEVGVEVAPLIASAGIVGLAVGFGAQTLVKDLITGVFILAENTVQVGDVAQLGGRTGVVEAMTVRTIRLRDLEGRVHTIPYSSVDVIENLTKDFSFALMDVGIAYREDTDKVVALLNEVAEDLRADEAYSPNILEPLEVLGLNELADSAVVIRVRLKCVPLKQWSVRREFYRRMKYRFDAEGVEIPFPHHTVYFGVDKDGSAPPMRVQSDAAGWPASPNQTTTAPTVASQAPGEANE